LQLPPNLPGAIDREIIRKDALDLWPQRHVPLRPRRQPRRVGPLGGIMVGGWGNRQNLTDRLDPMRCAVIVDKGDHVLDRRSTSARAK
jgi:hypothetical protein